MLRDTAAANTSATSTLCAARACRAAGRARTKTRAAMVVQARIARIRTAFESGPRHVHRRAAMRGRTLTICPRAAAYQGPGRSQLGAGLGRGAPRGERL